MPFKEIVGHSFLIERLKRQIENDALGHALLFIGPSGVGKFLVAKQVAGALVCSNRSASGACGQCDSCRQTLAGQHPDLLVIAVEEGSRQIKIEQIRQMQKWFSLAPLHGKRKVCVINDADTMQEDAASALLKTLEEPPPAATLILVAASENRLLPTIVSRCARLAFGPLPTKDLIQKLVDTGIDRPRAEWLARCANGRFGRALEQADEAAQERRQSWMRGWMEAIDTGDLDFLSSAGGRSKSSLEETRQTLEEMLEEAAAWYHDALLVQLGLPAEHLVHNQQLKELQLEATRWPAERLIGNLEHLYETHEQIRSRVNPRTAMAALIAKLATR